MELLVIVIDHHTQLALDDVQLFTPEEVAELKAGKQVYTSLSFFSAQMGKVCRYIVKEVPNKHAFAVHREIIGEDELTLVCRYFSYASAILFAMQYRF